MESTKHNNGADNCHYYYVLLRKVITAASERKDADILKYIFIYILNLPSNYVQKDHDRESNLLGKLYKDTYRYFCKEFIDWCDMIERNEYLHNNNKGSQEKLTYMVKGMYLGCEPEAFDHCSSTRILSCARIANMMSTIIYYNTNNKGLKFIDYISKSFIPLTSIVKGEAQSYFCEKVVHRICGINNPRFLEWMLCNMPSYLDNYTHEIIDGEYLKKKHIMLKFCVFDNNLRHNACYQEPELIT
jgi:hypothetical protein